MRRMTEAERQRDYYQMRVEQGMCSRACGSRAVPGRVECVACRDKRRAREVGKYARRKARQAQ